MVENRGLWYNLRFTVRNVVLRHQIMNNNRTRQPHKGIGAVFRVLQLTHKFSYFDPFTVMQSNAIINIYDLWRRFDDQKRQNQAR
jgi:hypothetical protein